MGHVYEMARGRRTRQEPAPVEPECGVVQWLGLDPWQWTNILTALEQHRTQGFRDFAVELRQMLQADGREASKAKHPSNGGAS